jgi:hypothetical protein
VNKLKTPTNDDSAIESRAALPPVLAFLLAMTPTILAAAPTAEQVFKSVGDNVNETADPTRMLALAAGGVGVLLVLIMLSLRRKRQVAPKAVNHQGKLLKEICKIVELKPAQLRKLKVLADEFGEKRGEPLSSPLVLLLCPSVLSATMKKKR